MDPHVSASVASRSPLALATGCVGAFVVASLAVQLVRANAPATAPQSPASVQPVVAHQSTLWQQLGSR